MRVESSHLNASFDLAATLAEALSRRLAAILTAQLKYHARAPAQGLGLGKGYSFPMANLNVFIAQHRLAANLNDLGSFSKVSPCIIPPFSADGRFKVDLLESHP